MKRLQTILFTVCGVLMCSSMAVGQECTVAGTWSFKAPALGSSTWFIDAAGTTRESGMGDSTGKTVLNGRTLTYTWTTRYGYDGQAVINLNESCTEGSGNVTWTKYPASDKRGPSFAATLTRSTWGAGADKIRATLTGAPAEVWVGWGRPSMTAGIFITGFRRNTADPVYLECPDATNGFGDHLFTGDRLKTVRIFPCGSNQQTYDWPAEGYNWGIMISAPARDLENDQQPGRPRDICIGTNPVRLRVWQKGAGEAFVTISPQLVLKQGLVGGGGTDGSTNCTGDARGGGTGAGGGIGGALNGTFAIQTANGNFLTAVRGGGIPGPGAINSDATNASGWETFTLVSLPDGKYAIKTSSGNYLTAMRGGGVTGLDVIHTDAKSVDAWEKFTLEDVGGSYAIKTYNGNYLTAVGGGGAGSGKPAIHTDARNIGAWERFKLVRVGQTGR